MLSRDLEDCEAKLKAAELHISSVIFDMKIQFYTAFASYKMLKVCYDLLRPVVLNGIRVKTSHGICRGRHCGVLPSTMHTKIAAYIQGIKYQTLAYSCSIVNSLYPTCAKIMYSTFTC